MSKDASLADRWKRTHDDALGLLAKQPGDLDELRAVARRLAGLIRHYKPAALRAELLDAGGWMAEELSPQRPAAERVIKREFREVRTMLELADRRREEQASREARHADAVHAERERRAVRREADRLEAEEASKGLPAVDVATLDAMLERPNEKHYRIDGLLPAEGRAILVAQRKTGKTTLMGNLAASLVTGDPFLGTSAVEKVAGKVMLANYEMSGATQARWLADLGLSKRAQRRIVIVNLRGTENLLATDLGRARFAALMREYEVDVLLVDTFGRAFSGDDQSSNSQVGPWLNLLDRTATEGGVKEIVLSVHAGWGGERGQGQVRARGASALEDWPDALWRLSRDGDARFFEAEGRDVYLESDQLTYDTETRRLRLSGMGGRSAARRAGKAAELAEPILAIVRGVEGVGASGISDALRMQGIPFSKGDDSAAIASLVASGRLMRARDGKTQRHWTPGNVPPKFAGITTI